MNWLPIDIAPSFVANWSALVAQRSVDGSRWLRVVVWDTCWGRDWLIADGVTHYCRIESKPPSAEDDQAMRDFVAITS